MNRLLHMALLSLLIGAGAGAQETGTVVGASPGAAKRVGGIKVERVVAPKATCESAGNSMGRDAESGLPEMEFLRQDLVCVRHSDGKTEAVRDGLPWSSAVVSTHGDVAYWVQEKGELHVFSPHTNVDTVIDTLPGAMMREIVWSRRGRTLAYFPAKADAPGIRVADLDSGKRDIIRGSFVGVVASPDPEYVVTVGYEGVQRFRVADGRREDVAKVELAAAAAYSRSGKWLGVEATPAADPTLTANSSNNVAEDDSPDCTGGSFALMVFETATKRPVKVPFPKGFDTVLDFEFSPDERAVAVTFGVAGCDYPGDAARVFVVSLADLKMTAISPENRLSVEAHWSPDGKKIVFLDYTGSDSGIVAADVATGELVRVTRPGQNGPDKWVGWR